MRAKKPAKKTGRKTDRPRKMGKLVPQPHGGAILDGMAKNHVPGPGRPPDEIRAKLRELGATKVVPFLEELFSGKVSVSLLGKCDACAHEQPISEEIVAHFMERVQTSIDHRLKASDQAFKYGLATKELVIASDTAAAFFDCVHTAIVEIAGEQTAEQVKYRALALMEAKA